MSVLPCPLCGYDAPGTTCPHCGLAPSERSLLASSNGRATSVRAGIQAAMRGAYFLASTRGTKRWLVPPFLITLALFTWVFLWLVGAIGDGVTALESSSRALEDMPAWLRWILTSGTLWLIAHLGGFLIASIAMFFAATFTFSVVYEALCGPFLDTVHGRIETRWFGRDPREAVAPQVEIGAGRLATRSAIALALAAGGIALGVQLSGAWRWLAYLASLPLAAALVGLFDPTFGRWARVFLGDQLRTLWTSVKASLLALLVLVLFLPLKFVPFVGWFLFGIGAGFATTLTLLDIPFSRRNWDLATRLAFLRQNLAAVITFGATAGVLFLVPVVGPLLLVPAASVGGLWLLCRLDKNPLRPLDRRIPRP